VERLRAYRGRLPANFTFDREEQIGDSSSLGALVPRDLIRGGAAFAASEKNGVLGQALDHEEDQSAHAKLRTLGTLNRLSYAGTMWYWATKAFIAVITVTLLVATATLGFLVFDRHRLAQFNRTYERGLLVDQSDSHLVEVHDLLGRLKPAAVRNSLQFVISPSLGNRRYAVSLSEANSRALGEAIITLRDGHLIAHRSFAMPFADLHDFLDRWDAVSDGYSGEGRAWTDGNHLTFERIRGRRVTSGDGNSPCHYDVLGDWAAQRLSAYVPELADLRAPWLPMTLISRTCTKGILNLR
jgi:hypothetical protein